MLFINTPNRNDLVRSSRKHGSDLFMSKCINNKYNSTLSLNIFEKNGTMNQGFRFVHNLAPCQNIVWEKSCLHLSIQCQKHQSFCIKNKKIKINKSNSLILKAYQQDEQQAQF